MTYNYFVYVNPGDSRTRIHTYDCFRCKNLDTSKQHQIISRNGEWFGFKTLKEAENYAQTSGTEDIDKDTCLK